MLRSAAQHSAALRAPNATGPAAIHGALELCHPSSLNTVPEDSSESRERSEQVDGESATACSAASRPRGCPEPCKGDGWRSAWHTSAATGQLEAARMQRTGMPFQVAPRLHRQLKVCLLSLNTWHAARHLSYEFYKIEGTVRRFKNCGEDCYCSTGAQGYVYKETHGVLL